MTTQTSPSKGPSRSALALEWINGFKVPDKFGRPVLPWDDVFKLTPEERLPLAELRFRPCECLVYDERFGFEVCHHDSAYGEFDGPFGTAWGVSLANQQRFLNNMQGLNAPNAPPPILTQMITKVVTDNSLRFLDFWGTVQQAIANAVTDCYKKGYFPQGTERSHGFMQAAFVHPASGLLESGERMTGKVLAQHKHALYCLAYVGTAGALFTMFTGGLTPDEKIARREQDHLFLGFEWDSENEPKSAT